jgi:SsrA-binding protein
MAMIIKNKKAGYEFFLLETFTAGIVLCGTEIKSIRDGKVNLTDSFCSFEGSQLFLRNAHIAEYEFGNQFNHIPKRPRVLLLTKRELKKLRGKTSEKGLTIVPVNMFINAKGFCKVTIALAKGKKNHDKRDSIKEKDQKRELNRKYEDLKKY